MGKQSFSASFNKRIAIAGLITSLLFLPFVFNAILSIGDITAYDKRWLVVIFGVMLVSSLLLYVRREKARKGFSITYTTLLAVLMIEILARLTLNVAASDETYDKFKAQYNATFTEGSAYEGHPFAQFNGKKNQGEFNNFGYPGHDIMYWKPHNVIRIACLGESTTADGYPQLLENQLNNNRAELNTRYETLNFAHDHYTSAHSMLTFLTTVLDFDPQFLIIHHGWSEALVRGAKQGEFRNDYSHALKSWERPAVDDILLLRGSVIFRYIKFKIEPEPKWMETQEYLKKSRQRQYDPYKVTNELDAYKRNLEHIIDIARLRNIKVILTTLPHTTFTGARYYHDAVDNIDQCNEATRYLADKYKNNVVFVDLDSLMTGKVDSVFTDLANVTHTGREIKTNALVPILLQHAAHMESQMAELPMDECRKDFIEAKVKTMRDDAGWREFVQKKADEKGITLEEMLQLEAIHMYNVEKEKFGVE